MSGDEDSGGPRSTGPHGTRKGSELRSSLAGGKSEFAPGVVLAGKYRIDKELSSGGMGVILVGRHLQLDQRVAIKVLRPSALESSEAVERFAREAKAVARIRSEHVARVIDVGELDASTPYMVMEYLKGSDLSRLLKDKGPLPLEDALEYVLQACEALAEAHSVGIVHRDIKPANLFLTQRSDGSPLVKVLDFGVSKLVTAFGTADTAGGLTQTSTMIGSPHYMSPEQLKSARQVDVRADIWSIGVVLFRLLTGKGAFAGDTIPELCVAILQNPPNSLQELAPKVSPELERVIFKCLEKDPEDRYANVGELAQALASFAPARAAVSVDRIVSVLSKPVDQGSMPPPPETETESQQALTLTAPEGTPADVINETPAEEPPSAPIGANASLSTVSKSVAVADSIEIPMQRRSMAVPAAIAVMALLGVGVFAVSSSGGGEPTKGTAPALAASALAASAMVPTKTVPAQPSPTTPASVAVTPSASMSAATKAAVSASSAPRVAPIGFNPAIRPTAPAPPSAAPTNDPYSVPKPAFGGRE